jgi:succinate dehydrogenase / fumarate reductase, membrane anchor subunit
MSFNTPLSKVRGLGSAKSGTHHFWWQRLTGIALVPLVIGMVIAVVATSMSDYESARAAVAHPLSAVLAICTLAAMFHHAQLGLQVVIEDYVHVEWVKISALILIKFAAVVLALLATVAVIRIAVGS